MASFGKTTGQQRSIRATPVELRLIWADQGQSGPIRATCGQSRFNTHFSVVTSPEAKSRLLTYWNGLKYTSCHIFVLLQIKLITKSFLGQALSGTRPAKNDNCIDNVVDNNAYKNKHCKVNVFSFVCSIN